MTIPHQRLRPRAGFAAQAIFTAITILAATVVLPGAAAPAPAGPTEVRIASEGARPPLNYLDGSNQLAGFEIDLGRDLCARMKVRCSFVAQDWDGLIPGLLAHHYDAVMAALEITDEAREKIAFSNPYVRMPSSFMAEKQGTVRDVTPDGLAGRSIGVVAGGAQQAFLDDVYTRSTIRPYETLEAAILDLAEGQIDLVMGDRDALTDFMSTRKEAQNCVIVGDAPHDPAYFGDGIAIGLRKEDATLKAMFDKALDESVADGSFARIRRKYFDYRIN